MNCVFNASFLSIITGFSPWKCHRWVVGNFPYHALVKNRIDPIKSNRETEEMAMELEKSSSGLRNPSAPSDKGVVSKGEGWIQGGGEGGTCPTMTTRRNSQWRWGEGGRGGATRRSQSEQVILALAQSHFTFPFLPFFSPFSPPMAQCSFLGWGCLAHPGGILSRILGESWENPGRILGESLLSSINPRFQQPIKTIRWETRK